MDWNLGHPSAGVRLAMGALAASGLTAGAVWGLTAAAQAAWAQAAVAAVASTAVLPLARAALDRGNQGRLHRDADGRWSDDRLGPIAPPCVVIDGGRWLLLRLQARPPGGGRRWVVTDATSAGPHDDTWAACRRMVRADAGRPQGVSP